MSKLRPMVSGGEMEFWTVVGGVATLAGLVVTAFGIYYDRYRRKKDLTLEFVSIFNAVKYAVETGGKQLKVFLGNELINNLVVCQLRILNSGGCPIPSADFERSLEIVLYDSKKIYFARVKEQVPTGLRPEISIDNQAMFISPLLMNPREHFTIEVGFDANGPKNKNDMKYRVISRIAGISEVRTIDPPLYVFHPVTAKTILRLYGALFALILLAFALSLILKYGWQ